jgi:hypothetical protein
MDPDDEVVWQDLCRVLPDPDQMAAALTRAWGEWLPQDLQAQRQSLQRALTSSASSSGSSGGRGAAARV